MHRILLSTVITATLATSPVAFANEKPLRPPAVPLVACDPYFSIWSPADKLTDTNTVHWTGKPHRLASHAWIDGWSHRIMGAEPADAPALEQKSVLALPTRTIYTFEGAGVALTLTFMTPAQPDDLDILSRPVTYLTYECRATDGREHNVVLGFDASAEIAVNTPDQEVVGKDEEKDGFATVRIGSKDQPVLAKRGDDIRIDWGYLYVAAPKTTHTYCAFSTRESLHRACSAVADAASKAAGSASCIGSSRGRHRRASASARRAVRRLCRGRTWRPPPSLWRARQRASPCAAKRIPRRGERVVAIRRGY